MGSFTHTNFSEVEDSAAKFGMGGFQEAHFATKPLDCAQTGIALHRVKPGKQSPTAHRHREQEELYVVLSGSGRAKLDETYVELAPLDVLRVDADVVRGFEGGPQGLEYLAFGAPIVDGDHRDQGEIIEDHWQD